MYRRIGNPGTWTSTLARRGEFTRMLEGCGCAASIGVCPGLFGLAGSLVEGGLALPYKPVPTEGICSPPPSDWFRLKEYALLRPPIGSDRRNMLSSALRLVPTAGIYKRPLTGLKTRDGAGRGAPQSAGQADGDRTARAHRGCVGG
eukprot:903013-Pyramimonas_sp.AAC.1